MLSASQGIQKDMFYSYCISSGVFFITDFTVTFTIYFGRLSTYLMKV